MTDDVSLVNLYDFTNLPSRVKTPQQSISGEKQQN